MEIVFRNVHLSFKEYATANLKYMWRQQKLRLLVFPAIVLGSALLQFYPTSTEADARPSATIQSIGLHVFITFFAVSTLVFLTWRNLRQRYDRTQFLQKPATYTFTEANIRVDAPAVQGYNSWETIDKLLLMKPLAVLTTRNFTVFFLDFRCLEAPATEADFLALVRQQRIPVG